MRVVWSLVLVPVLFGVALFYGCSKSSEPPPNGTVSAFVVDSSVGPLADIEITLLPVNLVSTTDQNGLVIFDVPPGEYIVDAKVCCVGPGFIDYHIPVTVRSDDRVEVTLHACLACV